jgi:hypothetical protein
MAHEVVCPACRHVLRLEDGVSSTSAPCPRCGANLPPIPPAEPDTAVRAGPPPTSVACPFCEKAIPPSCLYCPHCDEALEGFVHLLRSGAWPNAAAMRANTRQAWVGALACVGWAAVLFGLLLLVASLADFARLSLANITLLALGIALLFLVGPALVAFRTRRTAPPPNSLEWSIIWFLAIIGGVAVIGGAGWLLLKLLSAFVERRW